MVAATKMSSLKTAVLPGAVLRTSAPTRLAVAQGRVLCKAQFDNVKTGAIVAAPVLFASLPAMARIADTMNSEGTGTPLGITDNSLGWAILISFTVVWALYAVSAKKLGGGETDDSGMSL